MTTQPNTLRLSLSELQRPIQSELHQVVEELRRILVSDLGLISEVNAHLQRMKGKLFRPTLLLISRQATGVVDASAIALAAIVELIHIATLVHDDSVDHSVLRRGMPTINELYSHQISVIMGDYLYSRAVIELVRLRDLEPLEVFARVTNEMTIGEMRQLRAYDRLAYSEDDYDALIESKTAALFSGACEVGALQAAPEYREALRGFGWALGMAFQITDDVLDYTQPEQVTGKPFGLDLKEHKVTLPLIAALRAMDATARAEVESLFATSEPSPEQIARIAALVKQHGGLEYAVERALGFGQQAGAELDALPASAARDILGAGVSYVLARRR